MLARNPFLDALPEDIGGSCELLVATKLAIEAQEPPAQAGGDLVSGDVAIFQQPEVRKQMAYRETGVMPEIGRPSGRVLGPDGEVVPYTRAHAINGFVEPLMHQSAGRNKAFFDEESAWLNRDAHFTE